MAQLHDDDDPSLSIQVPNNEKADNEVPNQILDTNTVVNEMYNDSEAILVNSS